MNVTVSANKLKKRAITSMAAMAAVAIIFGVKAQETEQRIAASEIALAQAER